MAIMNRITNLLIFLIVISFILPTSAIMYASGQSTTSDNSDHHLLDLLLQLRLDHSGSTTSIIVAHQLSTDNSGSRCGTTTTTTTDNSGSSTTGGGSTTTTDNSGSSTTTSTQNNAALPSGYTVSNNTGNAYCDTCNNDIYNGGGDLKSMVLAVHNRERAAVGVPPLVWNDTLAADARTYAEHLATTGKSDHPSAEWVSAHPMSPEGENIAGRSGTPSTVSMAQEMQGWIAEKNVFQGLPSATGDNVVGHYTQMVWKGTTQVGCATAASNNYDVLVCRYTPPGNINGQKPY